MEKVNMGGDIQKEKIRNLVKGIYDIQKLRIATGNRIVQSFNIQMGQEPSTKQEDMDEDAQKMISVLRKEYDRITDAYVNKSYIVRDGHPIKNDAEDKGSKEKIIKIAPNAGVEKIIKIMYGNKDAGIKYLRSKIDYELIGTYVELQNTEQNMIKILKREVENHPMWDAFFKDVVGCGPLMSAVCISYFDIDKARHVSSFWKYAGLDVVQVLDDENAEVPTYHGEGRCMRHTEMVEYTDKDGNIKMKRGITYNPELKTKLCGVLASSFLKKPGCTYEKIYRDVRARYENRPDLKDATALHKHNMASRYMIKCFVRDLWVTWRQLAGYEVSEPYEVAKLGMKPHHYNEYHEKVALKTKKVV